MHFLSSVPVVVQTAFLLVLSNCFMTFAWYGHLKTWPGHLGMLPPSSVGRLRSLNIYCRFRQTESGLRSYLLHN